MPFKEVHPKSRLDYGWYVLASSFTILFFVAGARYSFGVMFKPMIEEFGWDRSSISLAFSLNTALYAISLTLVGRLYDRYSPKWLIIISTFLLTVGYALISIIDSLWQFYVFYGVLGAIGFSGMHLPMVAVLMSKWFRKSRGLIISLALSGNCLGQFILVPVVTFLVLQFGWRVSYLFIGLMIFIVSTTLSLFVIKESPNDLEQNTYRGQEEKERNDKKESLNSGVNLQDLNLKEAMGTASFWLFLIVMFVCGSGDYLVITHFIPFSTDQGISPNTAGNMLAWYGLMSLFGVLFAGIVSDVVGNKIPIALTFLMRFFLFLLVLKYKYLTSFYIFAIAFGFTYLITAPLTATLVGRLYGFSHMGAISGFITTVHHMGGAFWAYLGGLFFDQRGNYELIFLLSMVMAMIAFFCTLLIREKRHFRPVSSAL